MEEPQPCWDEITTTGVFKNVPQGFIVRAGNLNILTGANNSGKSAILNALNIYSSISQQSDYVSPRRFELSNQVAIALNFDAELQTLWSQRKQLNPNLAEFEAPDPMRELLSFEDEVRDEIMKWHNRYFGELKIELSNPRNRHSPARITIDGLLATQQGSGSRAVLSVLTALFNPKYPNAMIDEPEIGIEPQVQKRLAELIRKVAYGQDSLPKKRLFVATHSHIFLDREDLTNNIIVTKSPEGSPVLKRIESIEELHTLIYKLLGNSPDDLLFPENILVAEGPADEIFFRRVLVLKKAAGIATHFAEGDGNITPALPAIEQMFRTQAYAQGWYKERLCVVVDSSVSASRLKEWRDFLGDDGTRVRQLSKNGIEYFYPVSIVAELTGLPESDVEAALDTFILRIQRGARTASIGSFNGSKRTLANEVAARLQEEHLSMLSAEISEVLRIVEENGFRKNPLSSTSASAAAMPR